MHTKRTAAIACTASVLVLGIGAAANADKAPAPPVRPVLLTGEVEARDSQTIFVPPSNSNPVVLRSFVAEGTQVKKGDVLLRIEAVGAANVDRLRLDRDRARDRADSETATLEVAAVEAEKALASARAALDKAKVDAALPKAQVAQLDYDRYQAELDRATRDLAIKKDNLANANAAVARRREDAALETRKMQINEAFQLAQQAQAEVHATRDGVVVHGYSVMNGERLDEGASAFPGNAAGVVQVDGAMGVTAWVLEADRPYLREDQTVRVRFDGLPGAVLEGRIASITGAPEPRPRWGLGRYFRARIDLPEGHGLQLAPGMSVLVEPLASAASKAAAPTPAPAAGPLVVEGEIASRESLAIAPPTIPFVWQYKLAQLAPEGMLVQAGQPIATFDADEVRTQLVAQQATLNERERAMAKLQLDQAEADRNGALALAEARSNAEKAVRKAGQPKDLIRRVDYDKLVIERTEKAELARLAAVQYAAQQRARVAARAGLASEVAQLRNQIAILQKGQANLTVLAPRRGLVLYRIGFDGRKFSTGSQVWLGLAVATLADPDQLCVNAKVPEAQAAGVRVGQAASVTVSGARQALAARVTKLGRTFHAKSGSQAGVVRDVELQFDTLPKDMKPGAPVQVTLLPPAKT